MNLSACAVELAREYMNHVLQPSIFPRTMRSISALPGGTQPEQNPALGDADLVLVIDSDVPWIPTVSHPAASARVHHIDVDPLKSNMPLWCFATHTSHAACFPHGLAATQRGPGQARETQSSDVEARRSHWARLPGRADRSSYYRGGHADGGGLRALPCPMLARAYRRKCNLLERGYYSTTPAISDRTIGRTQPGDLLHERSGIAGLERRSGCRGEARGCRLDRTVVAISGDGSFMFGVPSTVHWMARRYRAPFLHVVLNNGGWNAPRFSTLWQFIQTATQAAPVTSISSFDPPPDYAARSHQRQEAAPGAEMSESVDQVRPVLAGSPARCPRGSTRRRGQCLACLTHAPLGLDHSLQRGGALPPPAARHLIRARCNPCEEVETMDKGRKMAARRLRFRRPLDERRKLVPRLGQGQSRAVTTIAGGISDRSTANRGEILSSETGIPSGT